MLRDYVAFPCTWKKRRDIVHAWVGKVNLSSTMTALRTDWARAVCAHVNEQMQQKTKRLHAQAATINALR